MPDINKYRDTQYLKQEDVTKPLLVTIDHCEEQDVSMEGQAEKIRSIIYFKEALKPLIANWTNLSSIKDITGDGNTDNWGGAKIVLYVDPNVSFGGKRVGGIRVSPTQKQFDPVQAQPPEQVDVSRVQSQVPYAGETPAPPNDDDDIPF